MKQHFDIIIIGSGAGGLSAAILLAKAGKSVLVLEQHYVPGGWCHSFQLGAQKFSPGVHYIGQLDKGESTNELYKGLGIADQLVFFRMKKSAYEHCHIGDKKFDLPSDPESLYQTLSKQFPFEKKLKRYIQLLSQVSDQIQLIPKMKTFWDHVTIPFRTAQMGKYGLFTLKRVIGWYIKDPLLKAVLNIQCGDHGVPPSRASFPVHCAVMNHYLHGGFYPMGGGAGIVKAMTNTFKSHSGILEVERKVERILIENKKAYGVQLSTGDQIFASTIISNADPSTTYLKLVGSQHLSKKLFQKLSRTKYSVSSLILFLTLDMDVTKAGIDSGNIWSLEHEDLDKIYGDLKHQDPAKGNTFPAVFISCTTLKDPTSFNGRYHNLEVITFIDSETFKQFQGSDYQSEAYTQKKNKIIGKLLNNIEKIIPGAKDHVIQTELGTPKTNEHYINCTNGNVYGTEKVLNQIGAFAFQNQTEIKNLYLCGASTLSHGVAGASYSGVAAASKILGKTTEELLKHDHNQEVTILDAEDKTNWPGRVHQKISDRQRRFKELVRHHV